MQEHTNTSDSCSCSTYLEHPSASGSKANALIHDSLASCYPDFQLPLFQDLLLSAAC